MADGQFGDVIRLETFDGNEIIFNDGVLSLLDYGQFGAPPTEWITKRGYKQHGVTEIDFLLNSRDIPLEIAQASACDRQTYWDNRAALLNFMRPNRNGPMTLTIRTPNDDLRSIIVRANPGFTFPPVQQTNNNFGIRESIELLAFNPLFFDYAATELVMSSATQVQLVFPITFPISFGTSDEQFTSGVVNYSGTWVEYPIITLTGPYNSATITNQATGVSIFMSVPIAAGETRIIDLTPGQQSITDGSGDNKFSDLGPGSNLVNFNLRPDPEVADGLQEITVTMPGGASDSGATLTYRQRYFGI
jgi:hypothetical protein